MMTYFRGILFFFLSNLWSATLGEMTAHGKHISLLQTDSKYFVTSEHKNHVSPHVPFYLYEPKEYEPRLHGSLKNCDRKGGDFMFLEQLETSKHRVQNPMDAKVFVVPCLFESYRRCTTTNHAEQPPPALWQQSMCTNPHPEDCEEVPWTKALDYDTEQCLSKVMKSQVYNQTWGHKHFWLVADWAMNFGRTMEQSIYANMTIGRIEVVDTRGAKETNRSYALNQSDCSVVVPYASDVAYVENFNKYETFFDWKNRSSLVSFRFEDRRYVLYHRGEPQPGAPEATEMRRQSLQFAKALKEHGVKTTITMERVPLHAYVSELHDSKFCLVMVGDTPSTHSFYDALAANCIPILISDRWSEVAEPFSYGKQGRQKSAFEYRDFVVQVKEIDWMNKLDEVVKDFLKIVEDENRAYAYFAAMQESRPKLLWSMPHNSVADSVLASASFCH